MKEIPLTQGKVALVDDEDYEFLMQWKWRASRYRNTFYAERTEKSGSKKRTVRMHRAVLGINGPGIQGDHRDGNGLNNTINNLRKATHGGNQQNKKKQVNNTSGYKGVVRHKNGWQAQIGIEGKSIYLGRFSSLENAAIAYNIAALEYHGEFARLNIAQ